ncbi:MAG: FKBP-type peptidyl-prolyl cis-trans isomerase FkpA [Cyclobacteriaceae bacterium]|jgi:FKBP-type peptidyl-prolyl cis-trans isomerase
MILRNSLLFFLVINLLSCGPDKYMKTDSGLVVQYLEHGDGEAIKDDSVLIIYMKQRNVEDKIIHHSYPMKPMALRYQKKDSAGHLWEVISKMKIGDSVYFHTSAQNLFEKTYQRSIPNIYIPESTIKINIKIAEQLSDEAYEVFDQKLTRKIESMNARQEALLLEVYLRKDGDSIDAYLADLGLEATVTHSGLRYIIHENGSGEKIQPGDDIAISYTAKILKGETFDSSYNTAAPFEFTVGIGSVMAGWEEGFTHLKKGTKATFYIPSPLAYRESRPDPRIPAYAIMVFDVEVVDVKKK